MENKKYSSKNKEINVKNSFPKEKKHKEAIKNNPYVQKWIECYKSKNDITQRHSILEQFCEFTAKNPTELIIEHRNDIMKENPLDIENIGKKQLLAFYDYLVKEKNVSENSARQYAFSKLASFYKRNNIPISFNKREIPSHNPKGTIDKVWKNGDNTRIKENERIECLKQIRDSFPHLRDKAIFLAKLSSGLDDIDLFQLRISDFEINEFDNCYLEGNRIKSKQYFQTFFNSESVRMIELYLKERESLNDDSWLFANNIDDSKQSRINGFSEALKIVCRKLDIKNITPKSLRRYFNTILKRNKIDYEIRERLLGHKIDISKGSAYDEVLSDEYRLAELYSEKIEPITLLGNGNRKNTETDKRLENLEIMNKGLEQTLEELKKDNLKITNIVKGLKTFIEMDFKRLNEDITFDYRDKRDSEHFKNQHEILDNIMKDIDELGLKE